MKDDDSKSEPFACARNTGGLHFLEVDLFYDGLSQRGALLKSALAALPAQQREAIVLQYYQALPSTEVAQLMRVDVETLERLLSSARRNLRAYFIAASIDDRDH